MSEPSKTHDSRALLAQALERLDKMQARLQAAESRESESIAIVGMGCRFPGGADDIDAFARMLDEGREGVGEMPAGRWDVEAYYDPDPAAEGMMTVRRGGFLDGIDRFDPRFFDISPREAEGMDPQQRLWLEVCWEALEHANIVPGELYGSRTGVFVGISGFDFAGLLAKGLDRYRIDPYLGTGASLNMPAGRLAYLLGLTGPAMAVDTACSSSLVSLHLACQSLRGRECDLALAGGVNALLVPETYIAFSRAGMLSPQGRCMAFSADADGFIRSEGCGVVALKRLSDAQRDGDRIWALLRGSAVNQDGASGGLTVPSGPSQQAVIRAALAAAKAKPEQVGYVEAHGTGTPLGDPIELGALGAVYGAGRDAADPLRVGSVKSNLGHLEAAAGIAGLIKTVLCLQRQRVFAHLHFSAPSPRIDWSWPVKIAATALPWPKGGEPRLAAVSSFGLSGTNAHLVLQEAPEPAAEPSAPRPEYALLLSARSEPALRQLARAYAEQVLIRPELNLADVCFTANHCRSRFEWRIGAIGTDADALRSLFSAYVQGGQPEGLLQGQGPLQTQPKQPAVAATLGDWLRLAVEGYAVDWRAVAPGRRDQTVLPTYPWQRQRYWLDELSRPASGQPELSPLLRRRLSSPALPPGQRVFEAEISAVRPGFLADHRVHGGAVLPTAAFIEMALVAAAELAPGSAVTLSDLVLENALPLEADRASPVQLLLAPDGGAYRLQIVGAEEGSAEAWLPLVSGRLALGEAAATPPPLVRPQDAEAWPAAEFYRRYADAGLDYGRAFRCIRQLWRSGDSAWARAALETEEAAQASRYRLHPALLDAALQLLGAVFEPPDQSGEVLYLPVGLRQAVFYGRRSVSTAWLEARRQADGGVDLMVRDDNGDALLFIAGLSLAPVPASALRRKLPVADWLYRPAWMPLDAATARHPADVPGAWLIAADAGGTGRRLAVLLEGQGCSVTLAEASAVDDSLAAFLASPGGKSVADLRGLDGFSQDALEPCVGLLNLARQIPVGSVSSLLLATRNGQAAAAGDQPEIAQAAAWGLAESVIHERPDLSLRRIDLDGQGDDAALLYGALSGHADENQLACRGGAFYARRLQRYRPGPAKDIAIRDDATYLISGGLGALGVAAADWLARRGARFLALLSRRERAELPPQLQRLQQQGVSIRVYCVDVADGDAMESLFRRLGEDMPPLRGVIHCAAVADDGLIAGQNAERLRRVMAPKWFGALHLHRLTQTTPLDFFLLYSSLTGVLGNAGQSAYAAANAALDALAWRRRAEGLPAVALDWGPWTVGLGAGQGDWREAGIEALDEAAGAAALDALWRLDEPQVCIAPIHWRRLAQRSGMAVPPLLRDLLGDAGEAEPRAAADAGARQLLEALPAGQRLPALVDYLRQQVARTLRLDAGRVEPGIALPSLGLDSLAATELRNRIRKELAVDVPAARFFAAGGVQAMAEELLGQLDGAGAETAAEMLEGEI